MRTVIECLRMLVFLVFLALILAGTLSLPVR